MMDNGSWKVKELIRLRIDLVDIKRIKLKYIRFINYNLQ